MDTKVMQKLSYGLFVLTAKDGDKDNGCIINTAVQVTSEPNRITIAVNKNNYTHDMVLKTGVFNVSILSEAAKFDTFKHFGFQSGRDVDKVKKCNLTPVFDKTGAVYFEEARLVLICRKTYVTTLKEDGFIDKTLIPKNYQLGDFHKVYFGEIVKVLEKK